MSEYDNFEIPIRSKVVYHLNFLNIGSSLSLEIFLCFFLMLETPANITDTCLTYIFHNICCSVYRNG